MNIRLYLDNIKIIKSTTEIVIPLIDIHTLIIDNQQLTITIPLINKCAEYNINLIICSIEHMPQTMIQPFTGNYQYPLMLKKQLSWLEHTKKKIHQLIIKNKIKNQADLLKHFGLSINTIQKLILYESEVELSDITNREGLAAKMYFKALFGPDFRRFDSDVVNAGLNYGYSILRSQISKSVIAKGLTPCLGIFHRGHTNAFNLCDDIIEVFRPIIDEYVYNHLKEAIIFKKEHRLELIQVTTHQAIIQSSKQTILNAINIFIDKLIDVFDKEDCTLYEEVLLTYGV